MGILSEKTKPDQINIRKGLWFASIKLILQYEDTITTNSTNYNLQLQPIPEINHIFRHRSRLTDPAPNVFAYFTRFYLYTRTVLPSWDKLGFRPDAEPHRLPLRSSCYPGIPCTHADVHKCPFLLCRYGLSTQDMEMEIGYTVYRQVP